MTPLEISARECRKQAEACMALREDPDLLPAQATILLTMARTWTALASLKERLTGIDKAGV